MIGAGGKRGGEGGDVRGRRGGRRVLEGAVPVSSWLRREGCVLGPIGVGPSAFEVVTQHGRLRGKDRAI